MMARLSAPVVVGVYGDVAQRAEVAARQPK
jgi:hypothetical protein